MRSTLPVVAALVLFAGCGKDEPGTQPDIRINELVPSNSSGLEENGTFPDWLELYNPGDEKVDLAGYTLTDDLDEPDKWAFPKGISIPAGGYTIVICDSLPESGDNHTNFNLNLTGEEVGLYKPNGTEIDTMEYGPIAVDYAWGRLPGEEDFVVLWPPTPGEENRLDEQPPGGAP